MVSMNSDERVIARYYKGWRLDEVFDYTRDTGGEWSYGGKRLVWILAKSVVL